MNTKHTPEPWALDNESGTELLAQGEVIALDDSDNLERIVVCVNALAGIADPEAAIKAAREALRLALGEWQILGSGQPRTMSSSEMCTICGDALALLSPK